MGDRSVVRVLATVVCVLVASALMGCASAGAPGSRSTPPTQRPTQPSPPPSQAWPGVTNTGVPAGTILKQSGSLVVTVAHVVLDELDIKGTIEVRANGVVIRRSRIHSGGLWLIKIGDGIRDTLIEDSEMDGMNSTPGSVAIGWDGFTARRVDIHGTEDGIRVADHVTVEDSWIHDLMPCPTCHNDGVQSTGGSMITLRHNLISWPHQATSCVFLRSDLGPIDDVLIQDNILDGGNWTIYSVAGDARFGMPTNVRITNNQFGRAAVYGISALDGRVAWSGNVWADTKAEITLGTQK